MFNSITSILLGLGGKCLLNWVLLLLQKHICRSFLGVFSISLTLVDGAVTLCLTALHVLCVDHVVLFGLLLTKYHVCLLVQIVGQIQRVLQWPVVVLAALDHFCTVTQRWHAASLKSKWVVYSFGTVLLWCLSVLYTFLWSGFVPVLEDIPHHQMQTCWVAYSWQTLHISLLLLLTLGCAAMCVRSSFLIRCLHPSLDNNLIRCRRSFVQQVLRSFFHSRTLSLVYLSILLLVMLGIPSQLDLNVAWLYFLNSLLLAVASCAAGPTTQLSAGLVPVPPECFCELKFSFAFF